MARFADRDVNAALPLRHVPGMDDVMPSRSTAHPRQGPCRFRREVSTAAAKARSRANLRRRGAEVPAPSAFHVTTGTSLERIAAESLTRVLAPNRSG